MDTMHGELSGHDDQRSADAAMDAGPLDAASLGNDERRMQVRAYNFWAGLLGDNAFPDIAALDPAALPDFGPRSVLLDFAEGIENPRIGWLGDMLAAECGAKDGMRLQDVPSRSLLSRITDHYMQILANEAPIGFEAEFTNHQGVAILYRGILLPFSRTQGSSGARIDFIYGVINWKERATDAAVPAALQSDTPALMRVPEMLNEWADGPADFATGDFGVTADLPYTPVEIPRPGFAQDAEPTAFADDAMGVADWLASARELAQLASHSEERSHQALYDAIGRAYDCALAAQDAPDDFAALVSDAGLKTQSRAPLIPLVKLVFGATYDKTRLTEFATAIAHAQRLGLENGALGGHLANTPGGLKAVVREERRLRRTDDPAKNSMGVRDKLVHDLRGLPAAPLAETATTGAEFTVLVARRTADGQVLLVGEVADDDALLVRAARRLLG
ncbi:hypothetical protein [Novosphingobium sp. Leaf2]|uniref:hypothetical protein n=1 Tax=Novosphingobium sp. Leaf2 TaxID=1735670 RepID=UPI0006F6FD73|nr:hypothetical protein [Novosphingobium sp. Leaf2]KQM22294.1 hypothetical protein ASE49_00145 [Novosphingobium sp. Leaf2]